jgi:Ca2+-binding EF-hand superfamily protein
MSEPVRTVVRSLDQLHGRHKVMTDFHKMAKRHDGCLPIGLFRSFVQYHMNEETPDAVNSYAQWSYVLEEKKCVPVAKFNMLYAMFDLHGVKRDTGWKNAFYNFKAMDSDNSGMVDREELSAWLRLAFRSNFLSVKCGNLSEDVCYTRMLDRVYDKYDSNMDGVFSKSEFVAMWKDIKGVSAWNLDDE